MSSPLDGAAGTEIFIYLMEAGFCLELFSWLYLFFFFKKDFSLLKYFPKAGMLAKMLGFVFFFFQFEMNR